jgi:hypothetical protein
MVMNKEEFFKRFSISSNLETIQVPLKWILNPPTKRPKEIVPGLFVLVELRLPLKDGTDLKAFRAGMVVAIYDDEIPGTPIAISFDSKSGGCWERDRIWVYD